MIGSKAQRSVRSPDPLRYAVCIGYATHKAAFFVLSKQMERYSEIEAQNLNLKADIKDEKECLLDLQNKKQVQRI